MPQQHNVGIQLKFLPVTPERWPDFKTLFGKRGACGGCWCMLWRLKRSEFEQHKGDNNKRAMKAIIIAGRVPGILAYHKGQPVAWCSVAPREQFSALERSRILKRIDHQPVWSFSCLFVDKNHREKCVSVQIATAAVDYVAGKGGRIVEAYPVDPKNDRSPPVFVWTGLAAGF